jgi:hypothetical protein
MKLAAIVSCFALQALWAQQREPAFEVYGLTGAYYHGNISVARDWKPQFGAGLLAPLGRNWGALLDVTTSVVTAYWNLDGTPVESGGDNFARERRVVFVPSFVRLWRRERFSIYAGGGLGFEHERQHSRVVPVIGRDDNGQPILGAGPQEYRVTRTDTTLALRFGTLVSLTDRVVLRGGLTLLPRYIDESASTSFEFGIGYRF